MQQRHTSLSKGRIRDRYFFVLLTTSSLFRQSVEDRKECQKSRVARRQTTQGSNRFWRTFESEMKLECSFPKNHPIARKDFLFSDRVTRDMILHHVDARQHTTHEPAPYRAFKP